MAMVTLTGIPAPPQEGNTADRPVHYHPHDGSRGDRRPALEQPRTAVDAGHMLTDNFAILLSFFAMKFATMPATERRTFGFYRLEILAALINGIILVLISFYIIYEAYLRILNPQPVQGMLMLVVAIIGLVANIIGAMVLTKHSHANLNIRGAYLVLVGDALSSVGVVVGGVVILFTGWYLIDPLLSILISFVIIYGAWALT